MDAIAVIADLGSQLDRELVVGLGWHANMLGRWRLLFEGLDLRGEWALSRCLGLVVRGPDHPVLRQEGVLARTVVLTGIPLAGAQRVWTDDEEIGRRAAEHLLDQGYRHLAFRGDYHFPSLRLRQAGFSAAVRSAGADLQSWEPPGDLHRAWTAEDDSRWNQATIAALPRPVALACYDASTARRVAADCAALRLAVPDEVAVLSCQDDAVLCALGSPALSAVRTPGEMLGFLAGERLVRLLAGEPPAAPVLVPPQTVVARGSAEPAGRRRRRPSTPGIVAASAPTDVAGMARALGVSRSTLERMFRTALGRTPGKELRRRRLERAYGLLGDRSLSLGEIAKRCGFASQSSFSHVFRRVHGVPPGAWRRRIGRSGPEPRP